MDPKGLSPQELERLVRRYTAELVGLIGPDSDILGPDLGADQQVMAWIMDTYSMTVGSTVPGVVTGKPHALGGSEGRDDAAGLGALLVLEALAKRRGLDLRGARVVVQGLGQVGAAVALHAERLGMRVVAVATSMGGMYAPEGLDVAEVLSTYEATGFLPRLDLAPEEVFGLRAEVLVLAAREGALDGDRARQVQAQAVVEVANFGLTPRPRPTFWARERWWCPTSSPAGADSSPATWSGCRTSTCSSGARRRCASALKPVWPGWWTRSAGGRSGAGWT